MSAPVEIQALESRLTRVEDQVRRVHEEVEACSVLVLQLDATAAAKSDATTNAPRVVGHVDAVPPLVRDTRDGVGGMSSSDFERLVTRVEVLESAYVVRGEAAKEVQNAASARLEAEIKDLWRALRAQQKAPVPGSTLASAGAAAPSADAVRDFGNDMQAGIEELRSELGTLRAALKRSLTTANSTPTDPAEMDEVLANMVEEVGKSTTELEQRTSRLEESYGRIEAMEVSAKADRQRCSELERMVELLVQQRKEDVIVTNSHIREMDARFRQIDRGAQWADEADALRGEIEEIRLEKIPSVYEHTTRTAQVLAEGLQALRKEVVGLGFRVDDATGGAHSAKKGFTSSKALENAAQLAAFHADLQDIRQQLDGGIEGGLEGRLLMLRADVSGEIESVVRKAKDSWADLNRRVTALEPWKDEIARVHAEVRSLHLERQEDRARFGNLVQDELTSLRQSIDHRVKMFRQEVLDPAALQGQLPPAGLTLPVAATVAQLPSPASPRGGVDLPPVVVLGSRAEWPLSREVLQAVRASAGGLLVTSEFEVMGVLCRLKFFPDGSDLRKEPGYCSLYLMAMNPVHIKFRMFAGAYETPVLNCTYDIRRDQGRNELVKLTDVLDKHGGVVVGVEVLEMRHLGVDVSK